VEAAPGPGEVGPCARSLFAPRTDKLMINISWTVIFWVITSSNLVVTGISKVFYSKDEGDKFI
jgi:hypothetical protein